VRAGRNNRGQLHVTETSNSFALTHPGRPAIIPPSTHPIHLIISNLFLHRDAQGSALCSMQESAGFPPSRFWLSSQGAAASQLERERTRAATSYCIARSNIALHVDRCCSEVAAWTKHITQRRDDTPRCFGLSAQPSPRLSGPQCAGGRELEARIMAQ
jgi:hypothetical protein